MSDLLIILFGTTILYIFAASRIEAFVKTLALQGFLLFLLVVIDLHDINLLNIAFLVLETLVVKTVVIPLFLLRVIRRNEIGREVEPHRPQFFRLLLGRRPIFLFGFVAAFWAARTGASRPAALLRHVHRHDHRQPVPDRPTGGASSPTSCAFMTLENGIFLLSLSVAHEMPMLINLGVLLDLFVGVYLLGIFFNTHPVPVRPAARSTP